MRIGKAAMVSFTIFLGIDSYVRQQKLSPVIFLSIEEYCQQKGYKIKSHKVTTEDGFILTLHRISRGPPSGPPILLNHGFASCSEVFTINQTSHPPAFRLVDANYDVWMMNSRGNLYSEEHVTFHPSSSGFWKFTLAEMMRFDIPTVIDYILEATQESKLNYLGYSQGACILPPTLSVHPKYEEKLNLSILLGVAGPSFSVHDFFTDYELSSEVRYLYEKCGCYKYFERPGEYLLKMIEAFHEISYYFSKKRYDSKMFGETLHNMHIYAFKCEGGTSIYTGEMLGSIFQSTRDEYNLIDYGYENNQKIYGTVEVPKLKIEGVKGKFAIIGGKYDTLLTMKDTERFREAMKSADIIFYRDDYEVDHGGLVLSNRLEHFDDIISLLDKENKT